MTNSETPIITSLLDTDFYKLSMLQAYFHQYPSATGRWEFRCRNKEVKLGYLAEKVEEQVESLQNLVLLDHERSYLKSLGVFQDDFLDWLQAGFSLDLSNLQCRCDAFGDLQISVSGKLTEINLLEVYVLSIVNQLYFSSGIIRTNIEEDGNKRLDEKIKKLKQYPGIKISEFGTRRRYSKEWQDHVLKRLIRECPNNIVGTSNVLLAMTHGIKPIGTCAHEWTCSHLGLVDNIKVAQKRALHVWQQEYSGELGVALSDTFTSEAFFRDFDKVLSSSYSATRHDSGCPFDYGEKVISHYEGYGIDPRTKGVVFSDGLTIEKAIDIWIQFAGRISVSFGIGTSLSNDCSLSPLNIVMKLLRCNGTELVKISDEPEKAIGDPDMIERVKQAYKIN